MGNGTVLVLSGTTSKLGFDPSAGKSVLKIEVADGAIAEPARSIGTRGVDLEYAFSFGRVSATKGRKRREEVTAPDSEYKEPTGTKRLLMVEYAPLFF